jgi:rhamnose transport system substrate-binding protein
MTIRSTPFKLVAAAALSVCLITPAMAADKIALVVKSLGNGFFDAAHQGAKDAAKELKDVEIIYTGPAKATAEGQIEIINTLIAQNVKAIVISANDPDALVPVLKKAMSRGIKVISFDSGVKKVLAQPAYSGLKLVSVVYGDDQTDKSYREAQGLFKSHPNLKAIVAPTTVGIAAAAKAVQDEKKVGQIFVTGLGLPSEMAGHVKSGAVKSFAIWNPIDLGYSSIHAAHAFIKGKAKGVAGEKISLGRVGSATLDANLEAAMAEPFTYDASNVEQFAKIF